MNRRHGFTLLELLVAVAILGVVMASLTRIFTTQHRAYVVVDQTTEVQQNTRAVAQLLEHDLRMAGFLIPEAGAVCGWDQTNGPDTLFVSDASVIRPVDQLLQIDLATGSTLASGSLGAPVQGAGPGFSITGGASTPITLTQTFVDVAADGPDFRPNGGMIVMDRNDPNGVVACGIVTNATGAPSYTVDFNGTTLTASGSPDVVAIPAHVYQVVTPPGQPAQLTRNGLVLVNHVEDFQIALFFDADDDRNLDPGEFHGDGVNPNANYDQSLVNGDDLREVRFNLVLTTRDPDPDSQYRLGRGQATENRVAATLPGQDGLRRRIQTASVRVRNVGND